MSYATVKSAITSALTGLGYSECHNLLEFDETPQAYNHKRYVLKVEDFPSTEMYTNNNFIQSYRFRLEVIYHNVDTTQRDANVQLYITLLNALRKVSDFKGDSERPNFLDQDDKMHSIGTFLFEAGVEGC